MGHENFRTAQVASLCALAISSITLFLVAISLWQSSQNTSRGIIEAEGLVVKDNKGRVRGELKCFGDSINLRLFDSDGNARVVAAVNELGKPVVGVNNADLSEIAVMTPQVLTIGERDSPQKVIVGAIKGVPMILVNSKRDQDSVKLVCDQQVAGLVIDHHSELGKRQIKVISERDGTAMFDVAGQDPKASRVRLGITSHDQSILTSRDKTGALESNLLPANTP